MRVAGRLELAVAVALTLVACSDAAPKQPTQSPTAVGLLEPSEPFGRTTVTLRSPEDGAELSLPVYDAFTAEARRRGLMHRERLPRRAGMVFRFSEDRTGGFWMKNTLIPLTVLYVDADGSVVSLRKMEPCTTEACPTYEPDAAYRTALEVQQSLASELGLHEGWRVELPAGLPPPQ